MKVSVITVCYNSEKTVESTIRSVENQTYSDIEYIVVDGKSKDGTLAIVKKYPHVVTKWVSEPDNGLYDAMNKGIEMATGDVVALINSDDLFSDDYALEKVMNVFRKNPELDSVYADLYYVAQDDIDNIVRRWKTGKRKSFRSGWHPAHPTFYLKREVYEKYGLFNLDFKLAADFEIMLRFLEKYAISTHYLEEYLVKMRLGGATNNSIKNIIDGNMECLKAYKINDLKVNRVLYPFFRTVPKLLQFTRT
ncbi:glycosyltransferase family 2 protein [Poritiphilus flavus]|uniref:Glycosyltransferase n=1 Tax=Poritiphilus flavus TaxID=2697053 RepID=A0A6L9E9Q1_9FLAO|nr:glycosyltransferase family 2 protein [Poritiphilus flavus]NAS11517.1 glycosyltransferase [Poritiphilus flavus]